MKTTLKCFILKDRAMPVAMHKNIPLIYLSIYLLTGINLTGETRIIGEELNHNDIDLWEKISFFQYFVANTSVICSTQDSG